MRTALFTALTNPVASVSEFLGRGDSDYIFTAPRNTDSEKDQTATLKYRQLDVTPGPCRLPTSCIRTRVKGEFANSLWQKQVGICERRIRKQLAILLASSWSTVDQKWEPVRLYSLQHQSEQFFCVGKPD